MKHWQYSSTCIHTTLQLLITNTDRITSFASCFQKSQNEIQPLPPKKKIIVRCKFVTASQRRRKIDSTDCRKTEFESQIHSKQKGKILRKKLTISVHLPSELCVRLSSNLLDRKKPTEKFDELCRFRSVSSVNRHRFQSLTFSVDVHLFLSFSCFKKKLKF